MDTNRRDLGLQIMDSKGMSLGKFKTFQIDEYLIEVLDKSDLVIGNGINRISHLVGFKKIENKCKNPIQLKSKYLLNNFFRKKPLKKIPKILYPYSPI